MRIVMQMATAEPDTSLLRPPLAQEQETESIPRAVKAWAMATVGDAGNSVVRMDRLITELKGWTYDLQAEIDGKRPVESFLAKKRGHCELYATTLALAARAEGIPARVVNGYSGGEWNEVGGFYLIRQQHAHSWVETWIDGRWQRFDPTPSSRWQLSGVQFPALDEVWESVKLSWYRYVLEFQDSDRNQTIRSLIELLKRYARWVLLAAISFGLILFARRNDFLLLHFTHRSGLLGVMDRWLLRHGISRSASQPIRHLPRPTGISGSAWQNFVCEWEQQAYGRAKKWSRWELWRHLRALS